MGYGRVLFCLVDANGKRLRAVREYSDDPNKLMKKLTRLILKRKESSAQLAVFRTGKSRRSRDFGRDPLADQEIAQLVGLKGGAIVPIQTAGSKFGTILIERKDQREPTREEVADLEGFARKLAAAIEQSERVNLLQSALQQQREPVLLLDWKKRVRFANEKAGQFLGIPAKWSREGDAEPLPEVPPPGVNSDVLAKVNAVFDECRKKKNRLVRHLEVLHEGKTYNVALLADKILDWRWQPIGLLGNSEDLSYVYRIFEVLKQLHWANRYEQPPPGETWSAEVKHTQRLIDTTFKIFTEVLQHHWVVLYQPCEDDPGWWERRVRPKLPEAFAGEQLVQFEPDEEEGWELLHCFTTRQPVAFCCDPTRADREQVTTERGLYVLTVSAPWPEPLTRRPGECWIDFPLLAGQCRLGKLTMACDPKTYDPERFEFLKVLSKLLAGLLEASQWYEKQWRDRMKSLEEAARVFQRNIFHELKNNLGELDSRYSELDQFRRKTRLAPEADRWLGQVLQNLTQSILRIKDFKETLDQYTSSHFVTKKRTNLVEIVKKAAAIDILEPDVVRLQAAEPVYATVDPSKLRNVLVELFQNSRRYFCPSEAAAELRIEVGVQRVEEGGRCLARLTYEDNGPGIPSDAVEQIFDQDYTTRPDGRGGFGMYYAWKIITAHGGSIRASNQPDRGALFEIDLPL
jgi:signal transduction histidine kinase